MGIPAGRSALWATMVLGSTLFLLSCLKGHATGTEEDLTDFYDEFFDEDYRGQSTKSLPKHAQEALRKYLELTGVRKVTGGAAAGFGASGVLLGFLAPLLYAQSLRQQLMMTQAGQQHWVKTPISEGGEATDAQRYNTASKVFGGVGALMLAASIGLLCISLRARSRIKEDRRSFRRLLGRIGKKGHAHQSGEIDYSHERGPDAVAERRETFGYYPRLKEGTTRPVGGLADSLAELVERPMDQRWPTHGWRLASKPVGPSKAVGEKVATAE